MRGAGARHLHGGRVAVRPVEGDVVRRLRPDDRRPRRQRPLDVGGRGQLGLVDGHRVRRVARLRRGLGDDDRHRLADVAHAPHRQRRHGRAEHRPAAAPGQRHGGRNRAQPVGGEVLTREDAEHAGHLQSPGNIHAAQLGVADLRTHKGGVRLAGHAHVVGEAPAPGEERAVFAAPGVAVAAESQ